MSRMEKWPIKVWCVCYQSVEYPGGWVPYSGEMFYYRDKAEEMSAKSINTKVKAFWIGPRRANTSTGSHG